MHNQALIQISQAVKDEIKRVADIFDVKELI